MNGLEYRFDTGSLRFDGSSTHVMAVVNVSPESKNVDTFSSSPAETLELAGRYRDSGATIIDLGAQSSHFDNPELEPATEIARLRPHLESLVEAGFLVSIDTWKPEVASVAIGAGAAIVNDTGGSRHEMVATVAGHPVALVAMYLEGENPLLVGEIDHGEDMVTVAGQRLADQLAALRMAGVRHPIVDPGIGISYRSDYDDYTRRQLGVVRGIPWLRSLGAPVLIPVPRKTEFARVAAFIALSLEYGADIIRVHDVDAACDLVRLFGRQVA